MFQLVKLKNGKPKIQNLNVCLEVNKRAVFIWSLDSYLLFEFNFFCLKEMNKLEGVFISEFYLFGLIKKWIEI